MTWEQFLAEGDYAVTLIRNGLRKRGINTGESIVTQFNTDEDIPVYDNLGNKIFWISVKTVFQSITDPIRQIPPGYKGWMCGEVESKLASSSYLVLPKYQNSLGNNNANTSQYKVDYLSR